MQNTNIHPSWQGKLCAACEEIFATYHDFVVHVSETGRVITSPSIQPWHSISALQHSAGIGCSVCKVVNAVVELDYDMDLIEKFGLWEARFVFWIASKGSETSIIFRGPVEALKPAEIAKKLRYLKVDICSITIQPAPDDTLFKTPLHCTDSTGSDASIAKIARWCQICHKHELCNKWKRMTNTNSTTPTRVIEITTTATTPLLRLVLADELNSEHASYATLSHCWGDRLFTRLLKHNFEHFRLDIDWHQLSKTFQEAVLTAARLGLRYIWIDALCIIQDSEEDWAFEAANMANVYGNSVLNIAADASANGHQGLYRPRNTELISAFTVAWRDTRYLCYYNVRADDIQSSPLRKRAWVVQERFLSPRVVRFGQHCVHFECSQLATYDSVPDESDVVLETALLDDAPKTLSSSLQNFLSKGSLSSDEMYDVWDRIKERYAMCDITRPSDRPVAIIGLVRAFCELFGINQRDYIFGMWRLRFPHELLWCATGHKFGPGLPSDIVPSWSWLSISGGIWPSSMMNYTETPACEVLNLHEMGGIGGDQPNFLPLRLRAQLCAATISYPQDRTPYIALGDAILEHDEFHMFWDGGFPEKCNPESPCQLYLMLGMLQTSSLPEITMCVEHEDVSLVERPSASFPALHARMSRCGVTVDGDSYCPAAYNCLAFAPTDDRSTFKRLGFARFWGLLYPLIDPTEAVEDRICRWLETKTVLDKQFQADDIPADRYDEVDDQHRYTFNLV